MQPGAADWSLALSRLGKIDLPRNSPVRNQPRLRFDGFGIMILRQSSE
jgi:hypothetical protein